MVQTSKCFLSHNTLNMNVVFNNTLNITKFYYQFQQQKVALLLMLLVTVALEPLIILCLLTSTSHCLNINQYVQFVNFRSTFLGMSWTSQPCRAKRMLIPMAVWS